MQFDRVVCDSTKRITGAYGWMTLPDGTPYNHKGIDLGWRTDEEQNKVFANCYGVVAYTEDGLGRGEGASGWGNYVLIKHPNGMYSRYAHLQKGLWVSVGQEVNENTVLGIMGDSGNVTARHLHFEVQTSASCNDRIDPTPYLNKAIWENSPQPTPTGDKLYKVINGPLLLLNEGKASIGEYPTGTIVKYIRDGYNLQYQGRTYHYYYVEVTTDGKQGYMASEYLEPYNEPTPQPTPSKKEYEVIGGNLLLLDKNYASIGNYPTGTRVEYLEDGYTLKDQDGTRTYHYYKVRVETDGNVGYMASEYLRAV